MKPEDWWEDEELTIFEKLHFEMIWNEARRTDPVKRQMYDALKKAEQFILNGIEFGYIKMPTIKIDTALQTPGIIEDAITAYEKEQEK
jgi:hypothetical protein